MLQVGPTFDRAGGTGGKWGKHYYYCQIFGPSAVPTTSMVPKKIIKYLYRYSILSMKEIIQIFFLIGVTNHNQLISNQ